MLRRDAEEKCKSVFCHNDALLENIIVDGDKVSFIDYEYGDRNYREYDIANHFGEFVGVGGSLDYSKHYPSKDFQLNWIREYLGGDSADPEEVEKLQVMVDRFSGLPHLTWGIWALIQSKHSNIDFDFLDYAIQRLNFYKKRRRMATIRGHLANALVHALYHAK